jgi:hypothetical protein
MWGSLGGKLGALILATLAIGLAACDDGDDQTSANDVSAADLERFLMQKDEEPGFRPIGQAEARAHGQFPEDVETITGVEALVREMRLTQADAERLEGEGFISFTAGPIRGPRTAGVSNVSLFAAAEGAQHDVAHETSANVIRALGPAQGLQFFTVPGIPGARGWTASKPHVGNVYWVQGRCELVLGNQGPGPFPDPLSTGARAIYERTNRECP